MEDETLAEVQAERDQLWQLVRKLELDLKEANQTIDTLSGIRGQLVLEGVSLQRASVVGASLDDKNPTLTLNRGENHGVQPGQVVASGFNLVGQVVDVGPVTSTVRLITAPEQRIVVRIVPPHAGLAPRELTIDLFHQQADTFRANTGTDDQVSVGDLAHLADPNWPTDARGFVVGRVVDVKPDPEQPTLRRLIHVRPVKDLNRLTRVVVLIPVVGGQ